MNSKILFSILIISYTLGISAQKIKIKNQRDFKYYKQEFLDTIGLTKPDFRQVKYEFRIWHEDFATGQTKMFRLLKDKKGSWSVKSLDYYCYNDFNCYLERYILEQYRLSETWAKSWLEIVKSNLLNIQNQKEVNKELETPNAEMLFVADGDGYIFEIVTKKRKRRFSYYNTNGYIEFYNEFGIKSKEYEKAIKLIEIIEREFDWTKKAEKPD